MDKLTIRTMLYVLLGILFFISLCGLSVFCVIDLVTAMIHHGDIYEFIDALLPLPVVTVCWIFVLRYFNELDGRGNYRGGLMLASSVIALAMFSACGHVLDDREYESYKTLDNKNELIMAYSSYYQSVETLLDSLDVNLDHPILESDCGVEYLNNKFQIDSLVSLEDCPD